MTQKDLFGNDFDPFDFALDGNAFDMFQWNDDGRFPKDLTTPCLVEGMFSFDKGSDGSVSVELLSIGHKSAAFDIGKVIEAANIPLEKA